MKPLEFPRVPIIGGAMVALDDATPNDIIQAIHELGHPLHAVAIARRMNEAYGLLDSARHMLALAGKLEIKRAVKPEE